MSTNNTNSTLLEQFIRFHRTNSHVYALFKQFVSRMLERGVRRASVWLIMNRIRWELNVETYGDDFKICNNYFALYARLFVVECPEHRAFFRLKRMKPGNEPSEELLQSLLRE